MTSAVSGATAALQNQIKRDQVNLDDWSTCVSAKTPKGQAEIQKFSGRISAARERLARLEASAPATSATQPGSSKPPGPVGSSGNLLDVWA